MIRLDFLCTLISTKNLLRKGKDSLELSSLRHFFYKSISFHSSLNKKVLSWLCHSFFLLFLGRMEAFVEGRNRISSDATNYGHHQEYQSNDSPENDRIDIHSVIISRTHDILYAVVKRTGVSRNVTLLY